MISLLAVWTLTGEYSIEDIVYQTAQQVVYRVKSRAGELLNLTRLVIPDETLARLEEGKIEKIIEDLKVVEHPCLRGVLDGGLDEVDGAPWFVSRFWEGESLEERLEAGTLDGSDRIRVEGQAKMLMDHLGAWAAAINFAPSKVVVIQSSDGSWVETFGLDLNYWVRELALGETSGVLRNPQLGFTRLVNAMPGGPMGSTLGVASTVGREPDLSRGMEPVALKSHSSGSKLLPILATLVLCGGIGWVLWWKGQQEKEVVDEGAEVVQLEEDSEIEKGKEGPVEAKEEVKVDVEPELAKVAKKVVRPDKTKQDVIDDFSAQDEEKLKKEVGRWVCVKGRVVGISDQGEWSFEMAEGADVPLKMLVEEGKADRKKFEGQAVSVVGFLEKEGLLKVADVSEVYEIEESELVDDDGVFTMKDYERILKMRGEVVTVKGVVELVEVKEHAIYFYFIGKRGLKRILAGKIARESLSETYDEAFFRGMKGKEVTVTGVATRPGAKKGMYVFLKTSEDFQVEKKSEEEDLAETPLEELMEKDEELERETLGEDLSALVGKEVTDERAVLSMELSGSKKTLYFVFTKGKPKFAVGMRVDQEKAEEIKKDYAEKYLGKRVRFGGEVKLEDRSGRLLIMVGGVEDLKLVGDE